jgi:2-polyprenyl-6-methoxyphenol hydroxylase-like FAD-dependent oxidoreductase
VVFIERHRLLRLLYSHIEDKTKVHDHTAIVSYEEESDSRIVVTTSDGRSFQGDILIGADGVHSRVRALMSDRISPTNQALSREIAQG